ncbi:NAD(P)-binding protein [Pseudonocardia sp. NPDC046786]|uniref:NAD(P)-binding protein n=1 Tax=Pseudonocardia sp. NPDC046786 TaxID=3155471 RepID=UPI0033DE4C8D
MSREVTVVGAGLGGLVAAATLAEAGVPVRLLEAKPDPGGRGTSLDADHRANWGPHVLYANGTLWKWLDARGLGEPAARAARAAVRFRYRGALHRMPPVQAAAAAMVARSRRAPDDVSFRDWVRSMTGEASAEALCSWPGPLTFHHDPGELAASFVQGRLHQVTRMPPVPRYIRGGWRSMIDRLVGYCVGLGVRIEYDSLVRALPEAPTVLAMKLESAARLLGDDTLTWTGSQCVAIDLGIRARRGDVYVCFDLDEAGWAAAYSYADPSLAPTGQHLVQAQIGIRPGESVDDAAGRLEALLDQAYPDWRSRTTWRRRLRLVDQTGAIDLPGTSWRDRPATQRGPGVHVVSDKSRAPGLLGEVAFHAALEVAHDLVEQVGAGTARRR